MSIYSFAFHHWESISFRFLLEISTPNKISAAFSNIYEECHMYLALWSKRTLMHISRKSFILITCHWSVSGSNPAQVQEDLRWIPNYFCTHTLGGGSKIELDRSVMSSSKFPSISICYIPKCYFLPHCLEGGNICLAWCHFRPSDQNGVFFLPALSLFHIQ